MTTYTALVVLLDRVERFSELGILGHGQKLSKLLRVDQPVIAAKSVSGKSCKLRVALKQPSGVQRSGKPSHIKSLTDEG